MTNDAQEKLIAAICGWNDGEQVLRQTARPNKYCNWWRYVDATVQDVWATLPTEAKLVAALGGLREEVIDSLYADP